MMFMLLGYGNRSKSGEVNQFRTLRGKIELDDSTVKYSTAGVRIGDRRVPSISLGGRTLKRNKESEDNGMELILHSMSRDEAMKLATSLIDYALQLTASDAEKKASSVSFPEVSDEFAVAAASALSISARGSILAFLRKLSSQWAWKRDEELKDVDKINASYSIWEKHPEWNVPNIKGPRDARKAAEIEKVAKRASWRDNCIKSLHNLMSYYETGDQEQADTDSSVVKLSPKK